MPRILISWIAKNNDFSFQSEKNSRKPAGINLDGPHAQLYRSRYFRDGGDCACSAHYLAFQPDDANVVNTLLLPGLNNLLHQDEREDYLVPLEQPALKDPEDDAEIQLAMANLYRQAVKDFESRYDELPEVHAFISPGFPSMQSAWIMLATAESIRATLWRQTPSVYAMGKELSSLLRSVPTSRPAGLAPSPDFSGVLEYTLSVAERERLQEYVCSPTPVLLLGPPGTGKSTLAEEIHRQSGRTGNFGRISVTADTPQMIMNRLLGYKKGAFTGAERDLPGRLDYCDNGTLFLDEFDTALPEVQNGLLTLLSEPDKPTRFTRLGETEETMADVRFVFATNQDLEQNVKQGSFRTDLLSRLKIAISIRMSPFNMLEMDDSDCIKLLRKVWDHAAGSRAGRAFPRFTPDAVVAIKASGFTTPRELYALCVRLLDGKSFQGKSPMEFGDIEKVLASLSEESTPDAGRPEGDAWEAVLNGLLSVSDRRELLIKLHDELSALWPRYRAELERRLKLPEFEQVRKHLSACGVNTSAKRLGIQLKEEGLID
jgi:DNA-binding NtrC family response regulator